jgi:hypothetical protein
MYLGRAACSPTHRVRLTEKASAKRRQPCMRRPLQPDKSQGADGAHTREIMHTTGTNKPAAGRTKERGSTGTRTPKHGWNNDDDITRQRATTLPQPGTTQHTLSAAGRARRKRTNG